MFRQLAGIFILFTFLFVKSNMAFADHLVEKIAIAQESQQDSNEPADDEKESKSMEFADEFIPHTSTILSLVVLSKKLIHTDVYHISLVHFPVWGPPPNFAVSYSA
ncbi:hypothetical protein [Pedobacter ginsengisoli]|uniref:hypothetical protein n=1 Tax=Pedobacter ginsengisoli TaxID=363852 RepID=UPI00254C5401|nr:hypothetical protein [Pedobacter ginsengisoli]